MGQYISKAAVVAELERLYNLEYDNASNLSCGKKIILRNILLFLDTLEVKEIHETAEAFARIIRANLTGIDEDVQYKFEQLYKEITGEKMYQGYND